MGGVFGDGAYSIGKHGKEEIRNLPLGLKILLIDKNRALFHN
jgi:hypothetical protein